MKKVKFIRFGGLSPVNHKKFYKMDTYHSPPKRKGIYCFIHPYIETFLIAWKVKHNDDYEKSFHKWYKREKRVFEYTGNIWVHYINEARQCGCVQEIKKEWVKIHTSDLKDVLAKVMHTDRVSLKHDLMMGDVGPDVIDPYKRGLNGWMSKDHLEVFIERI